MELGKFEPRSNAEGDRLQASEAIDKPFVALVREHRTGIITKHKPTGGEGVVVDVADVSTNEVWIGVLWMNAAVVDNLAPYVGNPVAIKLVWVPSAKGGNPYIGVRPLEGDELAKAGQWVNANQNRFDTERQQRAAASGQQQAPAAPADPWGTAPPASSPAPALAAPPPPAPPVAPAPAPAATAPPAAPAPASNAPLDPNDPRVRELVAQIANGGGAPPTQ